MNNSTTLNVVIAAIASMGQPTVLPVEIKQVSPSLYQYTDSSSTNLTESYRVIKQESLNSQIVLDLAQKLLNNSHDIPTEFNQIISENFWDLV
jgi:hypothetical protein